MSDWMTELFRLSAMASVAAIVVLCVRLLLMRAPKIYSCLLWFVVFCRAVLPVSFSSVFSVMKVLSMGSRRGIAGNAPVGEAPLEGMIQPLNNGQAAPLELPANVGGAGNIQRNELDLWLVIGMIYLAGLAVLLGYSLFSLWRLHRTVRFAVWNGDGAYESEHLKTAFVLGIFRPRIYLPTGLSKRNRRFILEHERIHIRRHDPVWKMAAWLITLLHWFNPLLWLCFYLMSRDLELSCDERVLKNLGLEVRADYGESLLALAVPGHFPNGAPLAFGEGSIGPRIKNVLSYRPVKVGAAIAALVLVAATAYGCMSNPRAASMGNTEEEKLAFGKAFAVEAAEQDADAVYEMLSPNLKAHAEDCGIYEEDGVRTMGFSSPFVPDGAEPVMSLLEDGRVQYVMMAMTSDPLWYVWKGQLSLEETKDGKGYQVNAWQEQLYDQVSSLSECLEAYKEQMPDYQMDADGDSSFGEWLQTHYERGDNPEYYGRFLDPEEALVLTLHLTGGRATNTSVGETEKEVLVTYAWPDGQAAFQLVRQKENGIWIPVSLFGYEEAE